MRREYQSNVQALKDDHTSQIDNANKAHERKLDQQKLDLTNEKNREIDNLSGDHKQAIAALKQEHEAFIQRVNS